MDHRELRTIEVVAIGQHGEDVAAPGSAEVTLHDGNDYDANAPQGGLYASTSNLGKVADIGINFASKVRIAQVNRAFVDLVEDRDVALVEGVELVRVS